MRRFFIIIITGCLLILTGCQKDFQFPANDAFVLEAHGESTSKLGEDIIVNCTLTNTTAKDYCIERGEEVITYSLHGQDNIYRHPIAIYDVFNKRESFSQRFTIIPDKAGLLTISVRAEIRVRPSKHAKEYKEYVYTKEIPVEVVNS